MSADDSSPVSLLDDRRARRAEVAWLGLAVVAVGLFVVAPMFVIGRMYAAPASSSGSAEAAIGIAALFRIVARRILRAGVRHAMQTTLGTFTRATSRTVTRRLMRLSVKSAAGAMRQRVAVMLEPSDAPPARALAVGFVALFASMWGILLLAPPATRLAATGGLSEWQFALCGAAPLLVYGALTLAAARAFGVQTRWQTALDGLLLQAYFTGAGSFLPLTTDVEYRGPRKEVALAAAVVIAGLLAAHWGLAALGEALDSLVLGTLAAMFLVYAFVYSFPITPLDGGYVWRHSRLLWAALWVPVLIAFVNRLPASFNAIL